jgi:putative transposase
MDHEGESVHGRADHRDSSRAGDGRRNAGCLPQARISSATFCKWKAKNGGLEVSDAKRLKALKHENAKLKKLLAEPMLDNAMLKDVASKTGDARREARGRRSSADLIRGSERRACSALGVDRSSALSRWPVGR